MPAAASHGAIVPPRDLTPSAIARRFRAQALSLLALERERALRLGESTAQRPRLRLERADELGERDGAVAVGIKIAISGAVRVDIIVPSFGGARIYRGVRIVAVGCIQGEAVDRAA